MRTKRVEVFLIQRRRLLSKKQSNDREKKRNSTSSILQPLFFAVAAALPQPPTRAPWATSSAAVAAAGGLPGRPSSPPPPRNANSSLPTSGPAPHHPPTAPSAEEEGPPRWPPARPRPLSSAAELVQARKCIFTAEDLASYNNSETFRGYISFLRFCAAAVRGVSCKRDSAALPLSPGGRALVSALDDLEKAVDEVPPAPAALRYGNPAFREWHARAVAMAPSLLARVLGAAGFPASAAEAEAEGAAEPGAAAGAESSGPASSSSSPSPSLLDAEARALAPFLSDSLGNASRIDYGTGHETLFATLLFCLARAGALAERDAAALVAVVFARYVRLCRRLQTTYWLEPAGSHGVWGLDDYCFLPFYWGAAQLDDSREGGSGGGGSGGGSGSGNETSSTTAAATPVFNNDPTRDGAPSKPSGIRSDACLQEHGDAYLYLDAVRFVRTVKKGGPLSETSPMLCDIAATVPTWRRVSEGLLKMYRVEVCGKLPIMQHQLFGHLFPFAGRM